MNRMSSPISATPLPKSPKVFFIDENMFMGTTQLIPDYNSLIVENNISRILTLTPNRNDKKCDKIRQMYYKHITFQENSSTPIILFFYECISYIIEAQKYDENVLILGEGMQSITVTVVIAFLMKKYGKTATDIFNIISKIWNIRPNKYFIEQLYLWQHMNCRIVANEPLLRRLVLKYFRYKLESSTFNKFSVFGAIRESFLMASIDYTELMENMVRSDPHFERGLSYECSHCKYPQFYSCHIIKNDVYFDCKYIYSDPIKWVLGNIYKNARIRGHLISGLIKCNHCYHLMGCFDWNPKNGCQCLLHKGLHRYLIFQYFTEKVVVNYQKK